MTSFFSNKESLPPNSGDPFNDSNLHTENNDDTSYENNTIPSYKDLQNTYEQRWLQKKQKFQTELKNNFFALTERFATGKQEIFALSVPDRRENLYKQAFLELFESGYAPHIGDAERLAGKKVRRLYITLPYDFTS